MQIKTLAEILAESDTDSASSATPKPKKKSKEQTQKNKRSSQNSSSTQSHSFNSDDDKTESTRTRTRKNNDDKPATSHSKKNKKPKKRFHPAATFEAEPNSTPLYQDPESQSIRDILAEVKRNIDVDQSSIDTQECKLNSPSDDEINSKLVTDSSAQSGNELTKAQLDNLPSALKAYLRTPEQKQAQTDAIKAESRLRWLAFYYLSRREHGRAELKQKLIDKEQDPDKIDALLDEFEEKGYQSDYRTTLMLIRENIRKGRGRGRIKQAFYQKKIAMPSNIDELIDMANTESDEFREFVDDDDDSLVEGVDWLKLAVTARTKKYGDYVPTEQKDKARQVRFLQYRGFKGDICFAALEYTLETLEERF
ncbi:regulatory protein RecX [Psychrobacter sp. DM4]|uniref:regulatory protein RecX n=1 Tax=Psychrobacter sp. DM4 TaxID=3440637 RepID=UPI003F4F9422